MGATALPLPPSLSASAPQGVGGVVGAAAAMGVVCGGEGEYGEDFEEPEDDEEGIQEEPMQHVAGPEDGVQEGGMGALGPVHEDIGGINEEIPEEAMEDHGPHEEPETFNEDVDVEGVITAGTLAATNQQPSQIPRPALTTAAMLSRAAEPGDAGRRYSDEEALGDDDGVEDPFGGGGSPFRLVYSGAAREFVVTELSPACRYRFRLRLQPGPSTHELECDDEPNVFLGWSEELVLDTDAADSAHRIDFEALNVFEVLGEGAFSVVYRGLHNERQVAVKRLKYQHLNHDLVTKFSIEVAILSRVRHRNVVAFVGAVTEQPNLCVVMEYMDGGSLHQAVHREGLVLPLPRLLQVAMDVAQGCHYLHGQKPMIIHRDLKSQNILLAAGGVAKIADFGLSRFQQDMASMTGQVGTPGWTAPEVYKHNSYNHKVDVYSFAVVLAECLSCEKPYAGMDAMQIAFATVYRNKRPLLPSNVPPALEKLIRLCWDQDPMKRPPFSRILEQLRAIERATAKEAAAQAAAERAHRKEVDRKEAGTSAEPFPAGRGGGTGTASASTTRPKSTTAPRESRAGSPNTAQKLRRQFEKGAAAARASGSTLSERTPTNVTGTGVGVAGAGAGAGPSANGAGASGSTIVEVGTEGGGGPADRSKSPLAPRPTRLLREQTR
jgi:serine/threonine protein kinase